MTMTVYTVSMNFYGLNTPIVFGAFATLEGAMNELNRHVEEDDLTVVDTIENYSDGIAYLLIAQDDEGDNEYYIIHRLEVKGA